MERQVRWHHHIEVTPAVCILASRVTRGSPKWKAVAAIILSGISGTAWRLTFSTASEISESTSAITSPETGFFMAVMRFSRERRYPASFNQIYDFYDRYGRDINRLPLRNRSLNPLKSCIRQVARSCQIPDGGMSIQDQRHLRNVSRELPHISRRAWAISSSVISMPSFAHKPAKLLRAFPGR